MMCAAERVSIRFHGRTTIRIERNQNRISFLLTGPEATGIVQFISLFVYPYTCIVRLDPAIIRICFIGQFLRENSTHT